MERIKEFTVTTVDGTVTNRYKVSWPTIQQMIDIESMKLALSKGKYTEMILSGTKWMSRTLNYIDMVAYFSVLCPELLKDSKINIRDLDVTDAHKSLLTTYQNEFLPWWNEYEKIIDELERPADDKGADN